ncbi:MAG: cobalt-zinc-cadmium efflux system protein [Chloroflexi bacterium]|nr:MAG: cobalt-zinc-cadmium efflux system protein [Chloroflexota bacterium]
MSHAHHLAPQSRRALRISAALTGVYFAVELAAGLVIGSVAVLSDAFHTASAVGGVLIAIGAAYLAGSPATPTRTFGLIRAEIFGAFLNGVFLLAMAVLVMTMGALRLSDPKDLATLPMLLIATGGLVTEVISLALLLQGDRSNLNLQGAIWHVVQTFVGSLIIIVAAVVIETTGFLEIDPILGIAFGVVLLWASIGIIRESVDILLEATPRDLDLVRLKQDVEALPGARDMHHVHAWTLPSGRTVVSAHLLINEASVNEAGETDLLQRITDLVRQEHGAYFSTIQLERRCVGEDPREIDFSQGMSLGEAHAPTDSAPAPHHGEH